MFTFLGSGHDLGVCPDCDQDLSENESICKRCLKRRSERKEIITEIAETEAKYGRDLRIIVEEFYRPMLVAGLLSSDQLAAIFLNADELIQVNANFSEVLRDTIETAYDSGDEDLTTVQIGQRFLESLSMLRAFESYCTRQVCIFGSYRGIGRHGAGRVSLPPNTHIGLGFF